MSSKIGGCQNSKYHLGLLPILLSYIRLRKVTYNCRYLPCSLNKLAIWLLPGGRCDLGSIFKSRVFECRFTCSYNHKLQLHAVDLQFISPLKLSHVNHFMICSIKTSCSFEAIMVVTTLLEMHSFKVIIKLFAFFIIRKIIFKCDKI